MPTGFMRNNARISTWWAASLLMLAALAVFACVRTLSAAEDPPVDLPVSRTWSGDYPVAQLDRLPEGQRRSRVGYLGDKEVFAAVWKAFKPGEEVPDVDFDRNLVVFSRNVDFYNRTNILKVTLKGGVAEILAMETMSALPIEEKAAMALAEIPRAGVRFLQAGSERIPVSGIGEPAVGRSGLIVLDSPVPGARVSSPLGIRGRARGTWFFEGDFPVDLLDASGNLIAKGFCTAKGEWMTKDFVPFEGTLSFGKPVPGGRGTLVLRKDNPTGLSEHDDALTVPLSFR